jgi:2-oxo-4-hydroxy-4-carboxy-5-ureidoimidazoline decarboxylase
VGKSKLDRLNSAEDAEFVRELGGIYEHTPWVAAAVSRLRPFATLAALHEAMTEAVRKAPRDQRLALIAGHPDLAGKAALAGTLTADSTAEQASAGLNRLSEQEFSDFHRLNEAYRQKFGMPFIVCVRRHSKDSILRQFRLRLENNAEAEEDTALREIFRITALRLDQHVDAPDQLKVSGRLSTHVLDTCSGIPARGVKIDLLELSENGDRRTITTAETNDDGRTDAPLIGGQPVPIGRYELHFHVADYFRRLGLQLADPPFLGVVPVQFSVADPEGHYHVPLLVTPWSYSTYRGS